MNLAAILGSYLLVLGTLVPACPSQGAQQSTPQPPAATSSDSSGQQSQDKDSAPQPQAQPAQGSQPTEPPSQKPSANRPRRHKKAAPPKCSNAPTAMNTTVGNPADPTNSTGAGSSGEGSTNAGAPSTSSSGGGSTNAGSPLPPCPPPKKVVRNGGSDEPSIQLVEGTTDEQASRQRSTDQLTAATQENLKKIAARRLSPSQQEIVSQIKQFMEQSKTAMTAGDQVRGHNLAMKAHLLSNELVKP